VLFLFASRSPAARLQAVRLQPVPVSSSQAAFDAVIGLGLITPGERFRWDVVKTIGWLLTPTVAGTFAPQNVFNLPVRPWRSAHPGARRVRREPCFGNRKALD